MFLLKKCHRTFFSIFNPPCVLFLVLSLINEKLFKFLSPLKNYYTSPTNPNISSLWEIISLEMKQKN